MASVLCRDYVDTVTTGVTDKLVTTEVPRPGRQAGAWRLYLGKCAVGALARNRSPRTERTRERDTERERESTDREDGREGCRRTM